MRSVHDMGDKTVRILRVSKLSEMPTAEIPRYDEEDLMSDYLQHEDDDFIENRPGGFKQRQIALMTAAVMWFFVFAVLSLAGSVVWRICAAIIG